MPNGAISIHKQLRTELENYIKSQLFGKSPVLLSSLNAHIDDEGLLYQKPYIESSPAYVTVENGLAKADLAPWMKDYFSDLAKAGIGIFPSPYEHQIQALEAAARGENLFVSTGTGSGKTECFMWPLLAKMASEARSSKKTWEKRGIRTIIMYPMNALVSDQVSRLRKMIGDPKRNSLPHSGKLAAASAALNLACTPGVRHIRENNHRRIRTANLNGLFAECLSRKMIQRKNSSNICRKKERFQPKQTWLISLIGFMIAIIPQIRKTQS